MTRAPRCGGAHRSCSTAKKTRKVGVFCPWHKTVSRLFTGLLLHIDCALSTRKCTIGSVPKPSKLQPPPLPESIRPVGATIAELRKQRGYSQEAFAEIVGITRKQVSDYETGKANLNHEMVIRFSFALGVTSDTLLGIKNHAPEAEPISLRFSRRMREIQNLPEDKKKAILKILDDLIRANS